MSWSPFEVDINGNSRPNSKLAAEFRHPTRKEDPFKLLERSLQNAVSVVIFSAYAVSYTHLTLPTNREV